VVGKRGQGNKKKRISKNWKGKKQFVKRKPRSRMETEDFENGKGKGQRLNGFRRGRGEGLGGRGKLGLKFLDGKRN